MGNAYAVRDQRASYFITSAVHQWVDVFTRKEYIEVFLDSVRHCQKYKGLEVFAWVVMTNHFHMIMASNTGNVSGTIRDLKKFTSKQIFEAIQKNPKESRKRWMLWLLKQEDSICFWEEGFHPKEVFTTQFFNEKADYIHMNPVRAGIVEKEEEYLYSSCGDFYGTRKGLLKLTEF